jgi:hypothetical protein
MRLTLGPQIPTVHLRGNQQVAEFLDSLSVSGIGAIER